MWYIYEKVEREKHQKLTVKDRVGEIVEVGNKIQHSSHENKIYVECKYIYDTYVVI